MQRGRQAVKVLPLQRVFIQESLIKISVAKSVTESRETRKLANIIMFHNYEREDSQWTSKFERYLNRNPNCNHYESSAPCNS